MKQTPALLLFILLIIGCSDNKQQWTFEQQIKLPAKSRPLSMALIDDELWFSDPQNYRLLKINRKGNVLDSISGLKRPMNIGSYQDQLYVPEFLTDRIWKFDKGNKEQISIHKKLKAPAGITVQKDSLAIADFYNHRIVLQSGDQTKIIGSKGHKEAQLYYPIDVKIHKGKIYVADAYNNRIQVFKSNGKFLQTIGIGDSLKVASGIDLTNNIIAVTDQEHNRVMLYNHKGTLLQKLTENITYPTDVMFTNDTLYIANFKDNALTVYTKKQQ